MLTIEALNSTRDLVASLADKGVTLRAKAGTPIAEAIAATKASCYPIDCLSAIDGLPETLYSCANPTILADGSEIDPHTDYQEAAADAMGIQLASHVAHATTVVLPVIADLVTAIRKAQDHEANAGVGSFKIEMITGSALLGLSEIEDQVDRFAGISIPKELPFVLDFKSLSDEELVGLMQIGASTYDDAVGVFISQAGMPAIREVWDTVFAGNPQRVPNYDVFRSDAKKAEVRNFATFLIASRLMIDKDKLPEVTGEARMSSAKYPLALRSLMEVSGGALYSLLTRKRQQEKLGKIIEQVQGKTVFVNKVVYDRYMADGGDIETILGGAISDGPVATVPVIHANQQKYQDAWTYYAAREKTNAASNELIIVRYAINNFIRQYVQTTEDQVIIDNRALILSQLDSWIESIYKPTLRDVYSLATRTVCTVLFNHTDADKILCGVTDAMQANPDITKEDALNLSVTDYVACWFASQIEIDQ